VKSVKNISFRFHFGGGICHVANLSRLTGDRFGRMETGKFRSR
jgi:hypothetical protein